jgi:hypothetical protein
VQPRKCILFKKTVCGCIQRVSHYSRATALRRENTTVHSVARTLVDDKLLQLALAIRALQDVLVDRVCGNQAKHKDRLDMSHNSKKNPYGLGMVFQS